MSARATTPAGRRRVAARGTAGAARRAKPGARAPAPAARKPRPPAKGSRPAAAPRRPKPRSPIARHERRPLLWVKVGLLAAIVIAVGYFAWFRDSSLVAVSDVSIQGLSGGAGNPAAAALTRAAQGMTTLDVDQGRLDSVASEFPEIASVSAHPSFPHGLTIDVVERPPVVVAHAGGDAVAVAADGTILRRGVPDAGPDLPSMTIGRIPSGPRLHGAALAEARVVGAAPSPLAREIEGIGHSAADGVRLTLRGGLDLRFGNADGAARKWGAAAAVLADPKLTAAQYVDVRVPQRPAIG
jgi:cell division protein FtsQ